MAERRHQGWVAQKEAACDRPALCKTSGSLNANLDLSPPRTGTMNRQYGAQRWQGGSNPLRVGTIPAGAVFYLQDDGWWRDRYRGAPTCRNPWIVEGFLNGQLHASRRNQDTGRWESTYRAGRSDTAVVRSLRDGRRQHVAVRVLILHEEEGLAVQPVGYPSLPDLRLHKAASGRRNKEISHCPAHPPRG